MMQARTETHVQDGATLEIATITHNGHDFSALGSVEDFENGQVIGYPTKRPDGTLALTSWDGSRVLLPLRLTSTTKPPRSFLSSTMSTYWGTAPDGSRYWGRGAGEGMLLRMRKAKGK